MTEAEWRESRSPKLMLEFIQHAVGPRKTRLFACACYRRFEASIPDGRSRAFLAVVEGYADGMVKNAELDRAYFAACNATLEHQDELSDAVESLISVCGEAAYTIHGVDAERTATFVARFSPQGIQPERAIQSGLLRDIFGNPFRPIALDLRWQSETVVALASAVYAERAFDRMPILADALEDAGCDHADILAHCRGDGPHVRGCWVVDLILGKS